MDVEVSQPIAAELEAVEEAYVDPGFYAALGQIPHIDPPKLLETSPDPDDPSVVHFKVRYAFGGNLSAAARSVLDPAKLTWTDTSVLDRAHHEVRFEMVPDHYADKLRFMGTNSFQSSGNGVTTQIMKATLAVSYPVVGPLVERAIFLGIRENLSKEAQILASWAAARGSRRPR